MADKEIRVVIDGKETVSPAAKEAEGAIQGFSTKAADLLKGLAAFAGTLALGQFFKQSIEEAQNSREAMGQLALAVNNSGASFSSMSPKIDETLSRLARMTKFGDDDFARAMQQMTVKTGDANWALENLGLAANVAAAGNTTLEDAANALSKAHEGQTKSLFSMLPFLKGATDWQGLLADRTREAAEQQMLQLGPTAAIAKQYGELQEAVGKVILGNDGLNSSGFKLAETLGNLANWIEKNGQGFLGFAEALSGLSSVLGRSGFLVSAFSSVLFALSEGVYTISQHIMNLGFTTQLNVGKMLQAFGSLASAGGTLLKKIGIDIDTGLAASLKTAGDSMVGSAENTLMTLQWNYNAHQEKVAKTWDAIWGDSKASEANLSATALTGSNARTAITKQGLDEQDKAWKEHVANLKAWYKILDDQVVSYKDVLKTMAPAVKEAMNTEAIRGQQIALDASKEAADKAFAAIKLHGTLPPYIKPVETAVLGVKDSLKDAATSALDVIDNFGDMDDNAKAVFQSCIDITGQLETMAGKGLTFAGVAGLIGAVGSIVSHLTAGSAEMHALERESMQRTKDNTDATLGLTQQMGYLALDVKGGDVAKVETLLTRLAESGVGKGAGNPVNWASQFDMFLGESGMTQKQVVELLKKFGIEILDKNGNIDWKQIPIALKALQGTNTAAPGKDFNSQLDVAKSGFAVNKTSAVGQLQVLSGIGGSFSDTLKNVFFASDIAGSRDRLRALFNRVASGQMTEAELGGLSGSQFTSLLTDMIARIDALNPEDLPSQTGNPFKIDPKNLKNRNGGGGSGSGAGSGAGTGDAGGATGGIMDGSNTTGPAPKTLDDVLTGITAQTDELAEYHTAHLSIARDHLTESRIHTELLGAIVANTAGMGGSSDTAFGKQILVERRLAGAAGL
jgi:hypothetical protein